MILAPTPRERERWYALLLLAQGWTASATTQALERDPHTRCSAATARHSGHPIGQLELEGGLSVCRGALWYQPEPQQLSELPPSPRGQALHRLGLGFFLKRPKKRLVKEEARRTGAKIFFADEAHFRADAELRGK